MCAILKDDTGRQKKGHVTNMKYYFFNTFINVEFHANTFVWKRGVSQILPPLTIVEGAVFNFNAYFRVTFCEFLQTDNTMNPITEDVIALGTCGDLQGDILYFSLETGKVFQRGQKDVTSVTILANSISRMN